MIATDIHVVNMRQLRASHWSSFRWILGGIATVLWAVAAAGPTEDTPERRLLYLCALMSVEAFATMSATLMLMPSQRTIIARLTNWGAIIAALTVWFLGFAADLWLGIGLPDGLLLCASVCASFGWFTVAALSS